MLNMFYERKITTEEVAKIVTLRSAYATSRTARFSFWDDTGFDEKKIQSFEDAFNTGNLQHLKTIGTKGPMALVRFVNHIQKIETRYAHHTDDRLKEVFGDGGVVFHLNNIDGWHP